jgi:predicted esterase
MSGEKKTEIKHIPALIHGRYVLETPSQVDGAPLLVGFHGYGETAERHMEELRRIPGASRFVLCAVQALHPFYNRTGDVIASWMTRLDREQSILDNVRYVASVVAKVKQELPVSERLVYLGFSQGAAMAYRAAAGAGHACQGLIVLGGDVPPELERRDLTGFPPVLLGRGSSEEWYDAAKMEHDVEILRSRKVDVRPCVFQGGHEWTDEFRAAAGEFLREAATPAS